MIQDFSVENYLSFDTRQDLSFEATKDRSSEDSLVVRITHPKSGSETRLLRMAAVYGANASGKTNLLLALEDVWQKLYTPLTSKDDKIRYEPFAMRRQEPTKMEVSFFIDGVKYEYKIAYSGRVIAYELLEFNPNGVMSLFYERAHNYDTNLPEITFGKNVGLDSRTSQIIVTNTLPNHSVLSTFNKVSVEAPTFEKVISYIRRTKLPRAREEDISDLLRTTLAFTPRKDFILQAVKEADFNICDIVSKESGKGEDRIEFEHTYSNGRFTMPIDSESSGTLSFVEKMALLYGVIQDHRMMIIDELDESLHYDLLVYFLQTFLANESEAQLLFTVHDQLILAEDFMRRDMVWFTEKSKQSSATELFSADDFNLHKIASIFNAYKLGKLGARPSIGSPFLKVKV